MGLGVLIGGITALIWRRYNLSKDKNNLFKLPEKFHNWAYQQRAEMVQKMAKGEKINPQELFLGFTRHTPVFISHGSAGLNGSVKGIGFFPQQNYMSAILADYLEHINKGWRDGYSEEGIQLLLKHMWGAECSSKIDFSILGSLEMAFKHSWANYQENNDVTLLYYHPPAISFEVRGKIEIHTEGIYHQFINAQHDVYHKPNPDIWSKRAAYVIKIAEIFDNSTGKNAFGTKIL